MDENFLKNLQTIQFDYGTLVLVDTVLKEKMRKEERKQKVIDAFGKPVPYRKNEKIILEFHLEWMENKSQRPPKPRMK